MIQKPTPRQHDPKPLKSRPQRDAVSPELRLRVLNRDHRACLAPQLDPSESIWDCRGRWGHSPLYKDAWGSWGYMTTALTLDHVKDQPRMGKRAPSDPGHLVTLCWHHHLDGWATAHRPELREYLRGLEGKEAGLLG